MKRLQNITLYLVDQACSSNFKCAGALLDFFAYFVGNDPSFKFRGGGAEHRQHCAPLGRSVNLLQNEKNSDSFK